jgi:hypothetical protein
MTETETEQEQTSPQEPTEAPESDDEPETEEETQEEPATQENGSQGAAGAMSEKEMEKAFKLLDREATRHRNRLSEIMGEDAQTLEPCPCCEPSMAGFMFPVTVAPLTEEKQGALLALLGQAGDEDLVQDPDYEGCQHCNARGRTLSGSKDPLKKTKVCDKCGGNGFVQKPIEQRIPALFKVEPNAGNATFPAAMPPPQNADEWGRPPGHAHYGIPPAYVMA